MPIFIDLLQEKIDLEKLEISFKIPKAIQSGHFGFSVLFDASDYPLAQHYCYMRSNQNSKSNDSIRRFVDMEFNPNEPGIPVGPWPGWRFIPEMPTVSLLIYEEVYAGRFNFWGDEAETKQLRVIIYATIDRSSQEVKLKWSDKRLVPHSVTIYSSPKPKPAPIEIELKKELHDSWPRLLFTAGEVTELQKRKTTTHEHFWKLIQELRKNWHLEFRVTDESKTVAGQERLHPFDRVVISSFMALMTEQKEDINLARQTFFRFLDLSLSPKFEPMQIDTQAGECLFTASIGCDWLWLFFNETQKEKSRDKLFKMAELVWQHLGYQRDDYAQAHFLGCSHGLLAFSFLFFNKHPRAKEWLAYFFGVFNWIVKMLPEDGFYPHGINLWIYEHIFLLRYLELFRNCADVNFWDKTSYWANASLFRAATTSSDKMRGITFGDPQYRVCGDAWQHFLIASRTSSKTALWLGDELESVSTIGVDFRSVTPRRRIWEFLYYNPNVNSEPFNKKSIYFEDGGQFFSHSENKSDKTIITFRAGGLLGKSRFNAGEWSGYGHSDPCNGSFLIHKNSSFLASGPGPVYRRDTSLQNTITIDDRGQIGDGLPWAPEFIRQNRFAQILDHGTQQEMDWIVADLAPCYLDFLGVQKCQRRFIFIRPDLIVVHDQVLLKEARTIQWNIHSFGTFSHTNSEGHLEFQILDKKEKAVLFCLAPKRVQWKTGLTEFVPAYPHPGERDYFLQISKRGKSANFLVIINLGMEKINWELLPNYNKKNKEFAKIIYMNQQYII